MRKVYDWFIQAMGVVFIVATLFPALLLFFFVCYFGIGVGVLGLDLDHDKDARAVAVLENTGLTAYTISAPYHAMTVDDALTAFITFKYDNHEDNTNLWDGIMTTAATSPNWHVEAVTCDEYTVRLNIIFPEAAFLLPADVTFDAWYEDADRLAFFDQDTGLMICLQPDKQPRKGSIKADGLKVPHDGFVYEMETDGGSHGDGTTYRALIVPEDRRAAFEADISQHADWHKGTVAPEEYACMHLSAFFEMPKQLPDLLPDPDIAFDWWLYVDDYARTYPDKEPDRDVHPHFPSVMQEAGAVFSLNWHIALYDADTGLFIFYGLDC